MRFKKRKIKKIFCKNFLKKMNLEETKDIYILKGINI